MRNNPVANGSMNNKTEIFAETGRSCPALATVAAVFGPPAPRLTLVAGGVGHL
jgi:hypothetical protein